MTLFSYFSKATVSVDQGKKIIASKDLTQVLSAAEILEKAKEDVAQYRDAVEKECVELRNKAHDEGFQKGLEEFNVHLLALEEEGKKLHLEMQKIVIPIALKAAKKIVGKEIELNPDIIVDIVVQAMAPARESRKVKITVNKADLDILEKNRPKLKELFSQLQILTIQESADMTPGGCTIETEAGMINATAENQWRALENAFARVK
jgi:type III secretion protein L